MNSVRDYESILAEAPIERHFCLYPDGIDFDDILGSGTSGVAALIPNTRTVLKFPFNRDDEYVEPCDREKSIYQLFQASSHPYPRYLLHCEGYTDDGILLEYAERNAVRLYLMELAGPPPEEIILRWAGEAAEALLFIHMHGVSHGDFNCRNVFLTKDMQLRVGEITNSYIHAQIPEEALQEDLRGFGSTLYEMSIGHPPFPELYSFDRFDALLEGKHPDIPQTVVLRPIIMRCWEGRYSNMKDIREDIKKASQLSALQASFAKAFGFILLAYVTHSITLS
ncbi:hypothetical protein FQN57_006677 [Myotisia sp. PD_48]|nr:hypothetical protein FQN57_006677 [Myotisia sp. PD_48]